MKQLFIGFLIFCLTGCVPAVIVAGATAGSMIIYDNRSIKTINQDHSAEAYAQRWLKEDAMLKGHAHISIAVFDHMGLLVGEASNPEMKARAFEIAKQVHNIDRVYDEITVGPTLTFSQKSNDIWINSKVRSVLLAKKGLRSANVRVVVENGVVYLMGTLTHNQADLASDAARKVSGVERVVRVVKYE